MVAERRSTYNPIIDVIDEPGGIYHVESESYGHIMYRTDIFSDTCTCLAGLNGRPCKHRRAARGRAAALRSARVAMLRGRGAAQLLEAFGI